MTDFDATTQFIDAVVHAMRANLHSALIAEVCTTRLASKGSAAVHSGSITMRSARQLGTSRNPRTALGNAKMLGRNQYIHKLVGLLCIPDDVHAKDGAAGSWLRV